MFIIPITLQAIPVETEIIQSKGGSQVINIPITGQTFTQLVITSKGYLIQFNSDSSRSQSILIPGLQFSGVKSDGCQISNDLIVIANADDKQLIFINITTNEIAGTDTIENFSNYGLSLSILQITLLLQHHQEKQQLLNYIIKQHILKQILSRK